MVPYTCTLGEKNQDNRLGPTCSMYTVLSELCLIRCILVYIYIYACY